MLSREGVLFEFDTLDFFKMYPAFNLATDSFVTCRLHVYADDSRWAVVFEDFKPSQGGDITLYSFGNCLINQEQCGAYGQYLSNLSFHRLISADEFKRIKVGVYHTLISRKTNRIKIRNENFLITHDLNVYQKMKIPIVNYLNPRKHVDYMALMRYLDEVYPDLMKATEEELQNQVPKDLPKILQLNRFYLEDYGVQPTAEEGVFQEYGVKPSSQEAFQLLTEIILTKDIKKWKPTLRSNNHWRDQQETKK